MQFVIGLLGGYGLRGTVLRIWGRKPICPRASRPNTTSTSTGTQRMPPKRHPQLDENSRSGLCQQIPGTPAAVAMIRSVLAPALTHRISSSVILLTLKRPTALRYLTSSTDDAGVQNIQEIKMPEDLGVGKIAQWYFQVGDTIKYDDVFVDIETPDFTFGMSHDEDESVILKEITAQVGDKVNAGDLVCVVLHSQDDDNDKDSKAVPEPELPQKE